MSAKYLNELYSNKGKLLLEQNGYVFGFNRCSKQKRNKELQYHWLCISPLKSKCKSTIVTVRAVDKNGKQVHELVTEKSNKKQHICNIKAHNLSHRMKMQFVNRVKAARLNSTKKETAIKMRKEEEERKYETQIGIFEQSKSVDPLLPTTASQKEDKEKNRLFQVQEKNQKKEKVGLTMKEKSELLNSIEQQTIASPGDASSNSLVIASARISNQSQSVDPLLPTTADSLKQYFLQNVSPDLANPKVRALFEHMLALLKASEEDNSICPCRLSI